MAWTRDGGAMGCSISILRSSPPQAEFLALTTKSPQHGSALQTGTAASVVALPQTPARPFESTTASTCSPLATGSTSISSAVPSVLHGRKAQYEVLEQLGVGAYAEVRRARNAQHASNGMPPELAVKLIDVSRVEGGLHNIENEAMIMEIVSEHPHIATLFEAIHLPEKGLYCLVMELVAGGELFQRVASAGPYAEDNAAIIMAELCDALMYLHGLGIVHRDVKVTRAFKLGSTARLALARHSCGLALSPRIRSLSIFARATHAAREHLLCDARCDERNAPHRLWLRDSAQPRRQQEP